MDPSDVQTATIAEPEPYGRLEPKHKACLVPQTGAVDAVPLGSPQQVFGRDSRLACTLSDAKVSRLHARILAIHNRYYLQDLDSTNGTYLNGNRITFADLSPGDLIRLGNTVFRFEVSAERDTEYDKKLNLAALMSLAEAVDRKGAYGRGHSKAVARLSQLLALELGFSPAIARRVGIAGRLHDIGKIGIPVAVLCKSGPLDKPELELLRQHPVDGETILAPLRSLSDLLPMVRQHHERFDGRGYPDGLAGAGICSGARIIHLADCYNAMVSYRPYRKPLAEEYIRRELDKGAGTQFDPEATQALLRLLPCLPERLASDHGDAPHAIS